MIALVLLTILSLAQGQTCVIDNDATWTSGGTTIHYCKLDPGTASVPSCTTKQEECYAYTTKEDCHQDGDKVGSDDLHCTWLAEGDGLSTTIDDSGEDTGEFNGICVNHPAKLCEMVGCIAELAPIAKKNAFFATQCAVSFTNESAANASAACGDVNLTAAWNTPAGTDIQYVITTWDEENMTNFRAQYAENDAVNSFDECYTNTSGVFVLDETAGDGSEWLFCHENMDDADPCSKRKNGWNAGKITQDVHCIGEESCEDGKYEGNVVCTGVASCAAAEFRPAQATDVIKCIGDSACEDAVGDEREGTSTATSGYVYLCDTETIYSGNANDAEHSRRDVCRGAKFKDNTMCLGENACENADGIDAVKVSCGNGEDSCRKAEIKAQVLECSGTTTACEDGKLTVNQASCSSENACLDARIKLYKTNSLEQPRVVCSETSSCQGATVTYVLPLFEGNESIQCLVEESCKGATLKAEAHCKAYNSCYQAYIARDVICGDEDSCLDTHMTQGTICCGPGCEKANTVDDDFVAYTNADDIGCKETVKSMKTHPTYKTYTCKRCGKETLIGWITDNRTNLIIAVTVCILVLLFILFIVGVILKKVGILNICMGKSTEEVGDGEDAEN